MASNRITLLALATLFGIVAPSLASACCDATAPIAYPAFAPLGYGVGCVGCVAPAVSGTPVAPAPIVVGTVVTPFGGPCCNWYGCGNCVWGAGWTGWTSWSGGVGVPFGPPSSLYVVNQGPKYSGPGVMVPYRTYSPDTAYAPAADYPYVPGYARPYYGRYAFHDPAYMNPRYQHVPHRHPPY
jgi:hypothetical protein